MDLFPTPASFNGCEPSKTERRWQVTLAQADPVPTLDGVQVNVELQVFWRTREAPSTQLGIADLQKAMASAAQQRLLRCVRSSSFAILLTQRDETARQLRDNLSSQMAVWGARVTQVSITALAPSTDLEAQREVSLLREMTLRLARHRRRLDGVTTPKPLSILQTPGSA